MFQPWRVQIREAELALGEGRLDEAHRLLTSGTLAQFLPAQQLFPRLAEALIDRAWQRIKEPDTQSPWRDLERAEGLGGNSERLDQLRQALRDRCLDEAQHLLAADEPRAARQLLESLPSRERSLVEVQHWAWACEKAEEAKRLAARGEFARAEQLAGEALALVPHSVALAERRTKYAERAIEHRSLCHQLHVHLAGQQWSEALRLADQVLSISPDDPPARDARRRAWQAVGARWTASGEGGRDHAEGGGPVVPALGAVPNLRRAPRRLEPAPGGRTESPDLLGIRTMGDPDHERWRPDAPRPGRFLLWVDGVGGYLVCPGREIVLGQAVPGHDVDVPLLGDLSLRQAMIRRADEGYLIQPLRPIRLDGKPIERLATLQDGMLLDLGSGVRMRFRRPHPLSASARLELVSQHRTQPPVDGIVLMADALVLGPQPSSHIPCRGWLRDVVLFTQGTRLMVRTAGAFQVDGRNCDGVAEIQLGSLVAGEDFSLMLEDLDSVTRPDRTGPV